MTESVTTVPVRPAPRIYVRVVLIVCSIGAAMPWCMLYTDGTLGEQIANARRLDEMFISIGIMILIPVVIIKAWGALLQFKKSGLHAIIVLDILFTVVSVTMGLSIGGYEFHESIFHLAQLQISPFVLPYHVAIVVVLLNRRYLSQS